MDFHLIVCIVIFIATLISYILNKIPMWMTSAIALCLLYGTGCLTASEALSGFSNVNTILMACMFIVAAGFQKTSFIKGLCDFVIRSTKGSFLKAYAAYVLLALILTNLISSPVATFAIMCPLIGTLADKLDVSRSKVVFPIMIVCVGCFGLLPFASAVQQASTFQGFLDVYDFPGIEISAVDFFVGKLPMLIVLPLWAIFIGWKVTPETPSMEIESLKAKERKEAPLTSFQDKAGVVIFFVDIIMMVFANQLGMEPWFIAAIGAIAMVIFGVFDAKSVFRSIPMDMIILFVGALGLGTALTATGAGEVVGAFFADLVGNSTNNYVLGALFFIVPFAVTQFMLNRAVTQIFIPICLLTCQAIGANPIGLLLLVSAGSLTAFLTPMATPSVAMAMSEGGYTIKDILKSSWLLTILISISYIFYTMTVYPAF